MGWFGSKDKAAAEETVSELTDGKKGKATPTRKEAEMARRERIKPRLDKKEAKKRSRAERLAAQDRALAEEAMRPANKLMRDFIDSRKFIVGEHALPIFMLILLVSFFTASDETLRVVTASTMWGVLGVLIVEQRLLWVRFKKLAAARIPRESLKGIWYYGFNRSIGPRRIRRPRPVVERGEEI